MVKLSNFLTEFITLEIFQILNLTHKKSLKEFIYRIEGENEERFPLLRIRDKSSVNSYAFQTLFEFIIRLLIHNFEDLLILRFHNLK